MTYTVNSACPLDCPDRCSFVVEVENQQVTKVTGSKSHPLTGGFVCSKAKHQVARQNSPDRVTKPLIKRNGAWQPTDWETAYSLIKEKLTGILENHGPKAILHFSGGGSEGLLQSFDQRFFNVLGGPTRPSGCVCWGSGLRAQEYDFGAVYFHSWSDLVNARTIILWGRDPMVTNLHIVPFIKEAKAKGAKVVVINPLEVESVQLADYHVAPRPGTDGALAMAMAHVLLAERELDMDFISDHVYGFEEFVKRAKDCSPQWAQEITGVPAERIRELALLYGKNKPGAILLGYGLQRYSNGGQTIRAIDALAALTGNIGVPGGGVNYGHRYWKMVINSLAGQEFVTETRTIPFAKMASGIAAAQDPPIKAIFVSKFNPITQLPDSNLLKQAFRGVEFKVVLDFFLNDSAEEADLFLPVATSFEQSDIILNSWNEYGLYAEQAIPPRGEAKTELEIFSRLAGEFGLQDKFGTYSREEWLQLAIEPLRELGINLETFKGGPVRCPIFEQVAWEDRKFATPSGKYELFSAGAAEETGDPLPGYGALGPLGDEELAREYPLQLMTPHPKFSLHSSFFTPDLQDLPNHPILRLHPDEGKGRYLAKGDRAIVETSVGEMMAVVELTAGVRPGMAVILEGSWIKDGGGVNRLISQVEADMGGGTAYYDCRCQVRKYNIDSIE
ncbi:MAG: molybdopterin-dependent oxidoreductase [Clostridia bacterium]|nr:molybdopterin-dependent oxidoreductase [Clostridia bacterium]